MAWRWTHDLNQLRIASYQYQYNRKERTWAKSIKQMEYFDENPFQDAVFVVPMIIEVVVGQII